MGWPRPGSIAALAGRPSVTRSVDTLPAGARDVERLTVALPEGSLDVLGTMTAGGLAWLLGSSTAFAVTVAIARALSGSVR